MWSLIFADEWLYHHFSLCARCSGPLVRCNVAQQVLASAMDARSSSCAHQPHRVRQERRNDVYDQNFKACTQQGCMHRELCPGPARSTPPVQPSSSRGTHTRRLLPNGNAGHLHAAITHAYACVVCLARGWRVGIGVLATKAPASAHTSSKRMGTYFANIGPGILRPAASGAVVCCSLRVGAQGPRCVGLLTVPVLGSPSARCPFLGFPKKTENP